VKPAVRLVAATLFSTFLGCGYHLENVEADPSLAFAVVAAPNTTTTSAALSALVTGARDELATRGQLLSCNPATAEVCPALVVELLAVEEGGAAPLFTATAATSGRPLDASVVVTLRARAFVRRRQGVDPERMVGEIQEQEAFARPDDPRLAEVWRDEAIKRTGKKLGGRLVRAVLW